MTIKKEFLKSVAIHGDKPALGLIDSYSWTYDELYGKILAVQGLLQHHGALPQSKVVLWGPNLPDWAVVYLATTMDSMVICPVLPDFTPTEVGNIIIHSEAKFMVLGKNQAEQWKTWTEGEGLENPATKAHLTLFILEDIISQGSSYGRTESVSEPEDHDLAAIIYTSGTTGASKGVMLSHHNIAWNAVQAAPLSLLGPGDSMLSVLPMAHTYECTLGFLLPLFVGSNVWYLGKAPAPAILMPALQKIRPHAMLTVPLFMEKIYRAKIAPELRKGLLGFLTKVPGLSSVIYKKAGQKLLHTFGGRIRFFGIGGAGLAPEVAKFLERSKFPYAIGYGLTETSPLLAGSLGSDLYSTGPILRGVEVKIAEPRNEFGAGEILAKGPNIMLGYYKDPVKTKEVIDEEGWFHTGDLGIINKKGHLFIKGRIKNLILGPSGENIYPESIEALINQDSAILESLVLEREKVLVAKVVFNVDTLPDQLALWAKERGIQLSQWGQDTSKALDEYVKDLKSKVNKQLSKFSQIQKVEIEKIPFIKTATMKIKRFFYK